jgi:hypothetical protein
MPRIRVNVGESFVYSTTLRDSADAAITGTRLVSLVLTLRNAVTGVVVNTRDLQDVMHGGAWDRDVTYDSGTGAVVWQGRPADSTPSDLAAPQTSHVAEFTFTATKGSVVETRTFFVEVVCQPRTRLALCTQDDVEEIIGEVDDEHVPKLEGIINALTPEVERYCERWFAYKANEVEYFSPRGQLLSLWALRFPIVSVASLVASYDSDFGAAHATTIAPVDYAVHEEFGVVRLRYLWSGGGERTLRLTYTGGLARETAALPDDLRRAVAEQAAYRFQRRQSLGVSGVNQGEGGGVTFMERDLLSSVKRRLDQFRRPVVI